MNHQASSVREAVCRRIYYYEQWSLSDCMAHKMSPRNITACHAWRIIVGYKHQRRFTTTAITQ